VLGKRLIQIVGFFFLKFVIKPLFFWKIPFLIRPFLLLHHFCIEFVIPADQSIKLKLGCLVFVSVFFYSYANALPFGGVWLLQAVFRSLKRILFAFAGDHVRGKLNFPGLPKVLAQNLL
jgi:hypothetical protein